MSRRGFLQLAVGAAFPCVVVLYGSGAGGAHAQGAELAAATPTGASTDSPTDSNAAIARRLLQSVLPPRCGVPAADDTIVVCGGRAASDKERLPLRGDRDAARATADGLPRAPNVSGMRDCSRGCIGFGSVPAPMYYFDITALPAAPPGSDADRIARGEIRAP